MTDQKVVLITGASSGIGRATAELLTSRGYRVFGTARNLDTVVPVQGVELLSLEVRDDASVACGVETALSRAGRAPHLPSARVTHRAARMRRRNRRTKSMASRLSLLAVIGALALAGHARAADTQAVDTYFGITGAAPDGQAVAGWLCPLDARVVALGEGSAVVYYTYDAEGADVVRVVTTVATDPDGAAAPARFVSYLSPGQKAEVSVAGAVGTAPAVLELAYDGVYWWSGLSRPSRRVDPAAETMRDQVACPFPRPMWRSSAMPTMTTTPTTEVAARQVPKSMRAVEARLLSRLRRFMPAGPVDRSVRKAFALI